MHRIFQVANCQKINPKVLEEEDIDMPENDTPSKIMTKNGKFQANTSQIKEMMQVALAPLD